MRWERLFADLEARAATAELVERDALIDDLVDGEWSATSWLDLIRGDVALDVVGLGRIEGRVLGVSPVLVRLAAARQEVLVARTAITGITTDRLRRAPAAESVVAARLGWGSVWRALADDGDALRLHRIDGSVLDGFVGVVASDAVEILGPSSGVMVPWTAIAAVRSR